MHIFFIRHGESFNNALTDTSLRVADPPLTERGRAQAQRLGAFVATGGHLSLSERSSGQPFDKIICSPMLRTMQTAQPACTALGLPMRVWVDVHEVGGVWVDGEPHCGGMSRTEMASQFPDAVLSDSVTEQGWWQGGQETAAHGRGRAIEVAAALKKRAHESALAGQDEQRVAIVSHGDFMSAIVKAMTDHLPSWGIYYEHSNTAITRFRLQPELCRVGYLNRIDHIDDAELVSP